jgi:Domain of unknown function (DUF5047)
MEPVSEKWRLSLTSGPVMTSRVEVLVDGLETQRVDLSNYFADGSIHVSRQQVMRSGTLTFVDKDASGLIVPTNPDSLLAPYGNQLRVFSGLQYPDGSEELVAVGTLRITKTSSRYPNCTVEVSDRSWIVSNARLETPWQVTAGTPWNTAIIELLNDRMPGVSFDITDAPLAETTSPSLIFDEQADPWDALQTMAAKACGCLLFFDPYGIVRMADDTGVPDEPVWTFDGKPNANLPYDSDDWANLVLYDMEVAWDTDSTYNAVVETGSSSSDNTASFRGVAKDTDPASPTQWDGPFGRKSLFETNELLTSSEQALQVARAKLQTVIGLAESLRIPSIPNPALAVNDAVMVIRPELGVQSLHVLDEFTVPLRTGVQDLQTRMLRVVP